MNKWHRSLVPPALGHCYPPWPKTQVEFRHCPSYVPLMCSPTHCPRCPRLFLISLCSPVNACSSKSFPFTCRLKAATLSPRINSLNLLWDTSASFNMIFCKWCGLNRSLPLSAGSLHEAIWFTYAQNAHSCWNEQATGVHLGPLLLTGQHVIVMY